MGSIWKVKSLTIWLGFEIWAFGWFCISEKKKKLKKYRLRNVIEGKEDERT